MHLCSGFVFVFDFATGNLDKNTGHSKQADPKSVVPSFVLSTKLTALSHKREYCHSVIKYQIVLVQHDHKSGTVGSRKALFLLVASFFKLWRKN